MSEAIPDAEDGVPSPESTDPSSLRALALSTLKRRKLPAVDTAGISSLPQRPPTTDPSLQLDYGQDDIGSSPTDVEMPPPSLKPSLPDLGDGLTREEGEISDSEEASSKAAAKRALAMAQAVVKVESPPHNLLDRTSDIATVSLGECIVDPDHVRPGLSLNQGQYDTAKDIVLDLLGWGVPPDYLVDCNLSREIVYYVFSELNLRLPHNFDIAGLIPYTPAHVAMHSRPLSATPPAPAQPANPTPTRLHPSLPPKPLTGLNDIVAPRPSGPSSPPSHPSSPPPSTNDKSSLHDIEQQRRQELLARKAVQASRKTKPPSDASSTASSHAPADLLGVQEQDVDADVDVEMTPAIPTEAVDDFLKTIGEKSLTPEASIQPESNDTMDVDEIPGFSSEVASIPDQLVISPAGSPSSATPNHSLAQSDALRTSGETDTTTTFELDQPSSDEQLSQHQALQRKGSKRPTAADFDDFDAGSRNGHRHHHGSGSMPNALRRKAASFASVSGHRKLVIDLSDSEGENGEDYVMQDPAEWDGVSGYSSPAPGRLPTAPGGRATPPVMTPAALMEKEKEIRKMRELIAEREKNRKQKVLTRSSTSRQENEEVNGSSTPHPSNGSLQEDDLAPVDKHVLPDAVPAESASTSSSTTPTPIDSSTADVIVQGTNDISAQETPQEPVAGQVDVDSALSSSAQTTMSVPPRREENLQEGSQYKHYVPYNSPFDSYPLLRMRSQRMLSSQSTSTDQKIPYESCLSPTITSCSSHPSLSSFSSSSSSSSLSSFTSLPSSLSSVLPLPDLTPLKLTALDPAKRICQYEVPGGGVCRDAGCNDLHLSRLEGAQEPNDHDTAEYLCSVLPSAWQSKYGVSVAGLAAALQSTRDKNMTLEERVAEALAAIGATT